MGTLYVTFSVMTNQGHGTGRSAVDADWDGSGPLPPLRFSEIEAIESKLLASWQQTEPSARNLILLDWKWLRDEAPSPTPET